MEKHKWHEAICAWVNGQAVQVRNPISNGKWVDVEVGFPLNGFQSRIYEFRIKPSHPTLGQICRTAWYSTCAPAGSATSPAAQYGWETAANAVKQALETGEYSHD